MSIYNISNEGSQFLHQVSASRKRQEEIAPITSAVSTFRSFINYPKDRWAFLKSLSTRKIVCFSKHIPVANWIGRKYIQTVSKKCASYGLKHLPMKETQSMINSGISSLIDSGASYLSSNGVGSSLLNLFGKDSVVNASKGYFNSELDLAKNIERRIFYPLVRDAHERSAELLLDIGIDTVRDAALAYAGYQLSSYSQAYSDNATTLDHAVTMTKAIAYTYAFGPTVYRGMKLLAQTCLLKKELDNIDEALNTINLVEFSKKLGFSDKITKYMAKAVLLAGIENGLLIVDPQQISVDFSSQKTLANFLELNIQRITGLIVD